MRVTTRLYRALLIMGMLVSSVALAQGSSVITGTVTDAATGKPVPDVVVTARSAALQGEQIVVTDSAGLYRLAQLPPGEYTLKLERESYKPFSRDGITVRTDRTVRVNVQVQPEAVQSEQIVVVARPPTVDVGSTTTGMVVGKEFVNNIAFIRPSANGVRSFESLASVAPQVTGDAYGYGFSGSQSPENQVYVDGVSVNDPGYGTNAAEIPVDFIQEANIITGGYQAEFGRAGGGIISAVTKSGSNEFHGSVFANYTPGLLSPQSPDVPVAGLSKVTANKNWNIVDFGAELGGPIVKDRLWFYVGVVPTFNRRLDATYLNKYEIKSTTDPETGEVTEEYGDLSRVEGSERYRFDDRRSINYIGKLTFLINSDNSITASVTGNNNDRKVPSWTPLSAGTVFPQSSLTASLKYSGGFLDKHLLVDVTGGWFHQTDTFGGMPDDGSSINSTSGWATVPVLQLNQAVPQLGITDLEPYSDAVVAACAKPEGATLLPCPATGVGVPRYAVGGTGLMNLLSNDRFNGKATVTYLLSALGHHVFKAGIDFERATYNIQKKWSGNVWIRQGGDAANRTYLDFRQYAYLTGPDQMVIQDVVSITPSTNQLGAFLQDSWSIMDLVTLNAGVRYDNQILYDGSGQVGLALNNMWSPRIGAIYDFTNQGRSKIYANYARYYFSLPLDIADRALSGENQASFTRACDVPYTDPNVIHGAECTDPANYVGNGSLNNPSRFAAVTGSGKTAIDPNLQPESKDEIVVGAEYELLPDLRVGASYTKSWQNHVIEDMSNDEAATYFIGNPGYGIASNFPKATRFYDAVTVVATKALSDGWLAQASFTYSSLRGNWAGFYRPETGQLDPGINSDFDLASLLANREGPLPGDKPFIVKAYASKEFVINGKLSFQLGLTYEGSSGTPISYLGSHVIYGDGEAFILPRGAAGRTPWVHVFNVKVGVGYRIDKDVGVQFAVDGLNVFNLAAVTNVDQNYTRTAVLPYVAPSGVNPQEAICANGTIGCQSEVVLAEDTAQRLSVDDLNPNFKKPLNTLTQNAYQLPMQWRFSIKFTF